PNSDTPYSLIWLDLRAEPMVISVAGVEKSRSYSGILWCVNTFNYGYTGCRASGSDAGDYMVASPDWKGDTPPGIKKAFNSTTQISIAILRSPLFNPGDMPHIVKFQSGYKVQPLPTFLKQPAPPAARAIIFPKVNS